MIQIYNKAVRDKIPEDLKNSGSDCEVKVLSDSEFLLAMRKKLSEEVEEYLQTDSLRELVDVLEVVYRIAELKGTDREALEDLRAGKSLERGGFSKNLFLVKTNDKMG